MRARGYLDAGAGALARQATAGNALLAMMVQDGADPRPVAGVEVHARVEYAETF